MSTLSPQFIRDDSPANMMLHDANLSDPYLSATLDPEEASFKSSAIRFTPTNGDEHVSSPMELHGNGDYDQEHHHPASYSDFLSPVDDFSSDLSAHTSPSAAYLPVGFNADLPPNSHGWQQDMHPAVRDTSELTSPLGTRHPSQLLTPNLTNNPTPSPDMSTTKKSNHFGAGSNPPQSLWLNTTSAMDSLSVHDAPDSARARSPIVKVESYSRGDSPVRDTFFARRRPSQSSTHLSPNDGRSDSDDEDMEGNHSYNFAPSVSRTYDGSWVPNATTGQAGVDPISRDDTYVPSPNQMDLKRQLDEKNADIRSWSASVSVANSEAGDDAPTHRGRRGPTGTRRRAKSAGDPSSQQDYFNLKSVTLPGPGILIHEISDDEDSEYESMIEGSGSDSPAVPVDEAKWVEEDAESPSILEQQLSQDEEPSPHQFLGAPPWRDASHDSTPRNIRLQPQSSTAAIVEFQRRARDIDTASRSATWGTRPLSEAEVNSIVGAGGSFENLSIDGENKKHQRRSSLRKLLQRKPSNTLKRHLSDLSLALPSPDRASKGDEHKSPQRKDSFPHRKLSLGRSRSPSLSTGGAVIAIAGQMAAIGGKDSMRVASPSSTHNPWSSLKARGRSRSEIPRASAPGLIDLMTSHGGPPVANIAYSPQPGSRGVSQSRPAQEPADDDDEDDDAADEKALVMEFPVQARLPVPTLDGFRTQITQLNPRLPSALIERFANEQLRRYKKLVDSKLSHSRAIQQNRCAAGKYCFAQGGEATLLAPRTSPQDPDAAHTQFQIPGHGEADEDPQTLGEGAVTAAQFPSGVPLPPVKRLPAEFECPVCFQVKKFQKPSDWTKHVHEDVQPFTCTFPHCTDPKSFKRKADWVRHESERHRKLEWWTCTVPDCHHTCYRKDNFVQHLVREHKMPEPKIKKTKTKGKGGADAQDEQNREREIEQLWDLVERCRHDTPKSPKEEPCRFCGNICSSWKKLTVHLAKHMEQIAMPVLGLVNERDLSSNPGLIIGGKTDLPSTSFAPNLSGTEADVSMTLTQPHFSAGAENGGLAVPFHPTYVPNLTNGFLSAEPEPMDAYEDVPTYGAPSVELAPGGPLDQSRFVSTHQNSVTYPPPFNAGPRPRAHSNLSVLPESYQVSTSPTETHPTYNLQQGPPYMSSAAANGYPSQGPLVQNMVFEPCGGYPTQL
ncbi:putative C2H2 finger domain protein [Aspergillus melleus]|uniref:putative C2H2 finger domain protein n=1 Tax=Aspergillus melleus TaxID=138277 RepID=UPI001E8CCF0C|nr:uncharacterized protein LDX57_011280 [Aspergillus melleus]KAH8433646.1 hypothetical protein LDX57_011280 [Aspergillus melleus]